MTKEVFHFKDDLFAVKMNISYFVVFSFEIIELTASVVCDNGRKKKKKNDFKIAKKKYEMCFLLWLLLLTYPQYFIHFLFFSFYGKILYFV